VTLFALTAIAWGALVAVDDVPRSLEQALASEDPAALARDSREQGDARRGSLLFHQPSLSCARCHVAQANAKPLGPDLSSMGKEVTDVYLIESILAPSKTIKKGFETVTIARTNGKVETGLLDSETPDAVVLRDPSRDGQPVSIARVEIEQRTDGGTSIMPGGLINQLASRPQFLDLLRYLREVADGGPDRARQLRPSPAELAPALPDYERELDHAGLIADLGPASFKRGEAIYQRVCANCHGTKDRPGSLPNSLRFASGVFKNGSDPYRIYQTLTLGYGQMAPQAWMVPRQKYDVIHYIREAYLKGDNPSQFARVDRSYLDRLPRGTTRGPAPSSIEAWSAMDYGPTLTATYEVGDDGSNFAYKGVAVRLDAGTGGISRGRHWAVYDHDTMRLAAAWSGEGFIDWNGINFNGQHGIHPRIAGLAEVANPTGPGWANPVDGSFADPRPHGRDDRPYGPLPRSWTHYLGQYRLGDRVILSYTVGDTPVLEMPGLEASSSAQAVSRTIHLGPRSKELVLQVARRAGASSLLKLESLGSPEMVVFPAPGALKTPREPQPVQFQGATRIEVEKSENFDLTGSDYTIASRFQTRRGGTLFCEAPDGPVWAPDGKSLFVRNGRLVFDIGWVGAVESRKTVADGAWHDAVATFAHQTGRVRLFIDGKADREGILKPKKVLADRSIRIGFTAPDFPGESYFNGKIAEVRFYPKAIEPNEAARLFEAAPTDDRLVGRWFPDQARGEFVPDATGHAHRGKVLGRLKPSQAEGSILVGLAPSVPGIEWLATPTGDLRLKIPAGAQPVQFTIALAHLAEGADPKALASSIEIKPPPDLATMTRGGPPRWPEVLKTSATLGKSDGPFAVDVLATPDANPWLAQMRLTGFDFFDGGRSAVVCTWDGDVWRVEGLDDVAKGLAWRRIASGLFQPLGLKIVGGKIHVGCRDQIAILHDLNGDGETDFYENFNSDHQVTDHFHEFAMDLQTDSLGNFYYAKGARHGLKAVVPHHGTLLRVSKDGSKTDVLATGFRAPNGVCVNDDGTFFLTDQEGFWTPKNRINWVKPGGFYGNMWGYTDVTDPADSAMEQPVCWITNAVDRSPAEVLRVEGDGWGPLKGSLLNLSYGEGKIFVVPNEVIDGRMQGGVAALPLPPFPTGVMRGRFSPRDGQLYALGMFAWAGNRQQPGGFYRVRYTGKPVHLPIGLEAKSRGMLLRFSGPIDKKAASDPARYAVKTWSLKRSEGYGSNHIGERPSRILAARPTEDGRGVFLELEGFHPTQCMEIRYTLKGEGGEPVEGSIDNSVHRTRD
jgi:putative heme-binding domain-containing protein